MQSEPFSVMICIFTPYFCYYWCMLYLREYGSSKATITSVEGNTSVAQLLFLLLQRVFKLNRPHCDRSLFSLFHSPSLFSFHSWCGQRNVSTCNTNGGLKCKCDLYDGDLLWGDFAPKAAAALVGCPSSLLFR